MRTIPKSKNAINLQPVPPFRLDLTVWALRRRPENIVDDWDGQSYRRVLALADNRPAEIIVTQETSPEKPKLQIVVAGVRLRPEVRAVVVSAVERMLGLRSNLTGFYRLASRDIRLGRLVQRFRGMKPPRFPTVWESVVNGIACQQVTLTLGIRLLNRLGEICGLPSRASDRPAQAFPRPEDLAEMDVKALRQLGFSGQKALALCELAQSVSQGELDLEALTAEDDETALAQLQRLRGVGRWTAEYVLLRGLGRLHIFPGDDVGARNNLRRWLHLTRALDYEGVGRTISRWRDYGGLVYFHLLLDRLADAGQLKEVSP